MPGATIPNPSATVNETQVRIATSRGRSRNGPRWARDTKGSLPAMPASLAARPLAQGSTGLAEGNAGLAEGNAGLAEGNAGLAEGNAGLAEGNAGLLRWRAAMRSVSATPGCGQLRQVPPRWGCALGAGPT